MPFKEQEPIAVIGMGCRFPGGANSPEELWSLVAEGRNAWTEVPADRFKSSSFYHPDSDSRGNTNHKGGHFLDQGIAAFDAEFFGISPQEAEALDPQQRVVLEASWEAVENAGIPMNAFKGSDTAVFVGMFGHDFEHMITKDPMAFTKYHNTGAARTLLANRVSYVFDLHGPSVMIDTGCSGSIIAVNSACQSLRSGETDMALAGGVGLIFSPDQFAMINQTGILNPEGKCFAFDDRGKGYGRGEGVGIVALKRLDDAMRDGDNIRAVIRSCGANQDGKTNGITLPSSIAQECLAGRMFQGLAFAPSEVHYVEAHGTGTKAGDVAEMGAIRKVFCEGRDSKNPLFVGTAKPNLGHSEAASGSAGLIKTIMAMEKGFIPPNILLENLKPGLELDQWNIKVARNLESWPSTDGTRKAVVNSFGSGGTNAMVVLESLGDPNRALEIGTNGNGNGLVTTNGSHKSIPPTNGYVHIEGAVEHQNDFRLFTLSARSEHSLTHWIQDLKKYLQKHDNLSLNDLSYTLTSRRSNFQWRSSIVAQDVKSLVQKLDAKEHVPAKTLFQVGNVFIFSGQGTQHWRMGYELLSTKSEFSRSIQLSDQYLQSLGAEWSLVEELCRDEGSSKLNDSKYGQPASTAIQVALVDLLKSWNVVPLAVIGHSSGEIAAAYSAGSINHRTAIQASYERSFLAEAAREQSLQRGAMMAVGVGEDEVREYISQLTSSQVVVACINSPSSTTVSGDAPAVKELQELLKSKDIFARLLKVDTAYHSHHMKRVSKNYLDRLEGLQSGSTSADIRYFSTVSGVEKSDDFGASYWVENLVSPVRFDGAFQALAREMGQIPLNLIEIGAHKALGGPIRQSLAKQQAGGLSYRYIPTLVRGEDSCMSLMETASNLFKTGGDLHVDVAASLGISDLSPSVIRDLPSYHWNHTTTHWNEPRLSKDYRFRRYPHHDLLGLRTTTSPDREPSWRIILTLDSLPWLKDHIVDSFVVFPGSGYMAMAIEGLKQLHQDQHPNSAITNFQLKNISFKRTLTLSNDTAGVEVILTLRHSGSSGYDFAVSSISEQGNWQEHCDGKISATLEAALDEVEQTREIDLRLKTHADSLKIAESSCVELVEQAELYHTLASAGNQYGPTFAVVKEAHLAKSKSLSTVIIPNIAAIMPSQWQQPHVIHPTTFDALLHTCVLLFSRVSSHGSVMPVFIGNVFISADILNEPGQYLQVLCDLKTTFASSSNFDIVAFQENSGHEFIPVLTISDGEVRVIGASQETSKAGSDNIFKMQWGLDMSSVKAEALESVVIPLQSDEIGVTPAEKTVALDIACTQFIDWAVKEVDQRGLKVRDDYRISLFTWMKSLVSSVAGQSSLQNGTWTKENIVQELMKLGLEGELVARMGPHLTSVLVGEADPLAMLLEGDFLYRVYNGDAMTRGNRYLAEYTKHFAFQRSGIRILEIGAGTGGATFQLLQQCSPNGEAFASEYAFTDISPGYFDAVRTSSLKKWAHMLTFKKLDLEKDPIAQGFEEHGYDLILASNVVHATVSLTQSLSHIHRLLKPGGVLGLMEIVKTAPLHNMTFGLLPGWWAGVVDGRTSSPLQTTEQWNRRLIDNSFTGVDMVAYDFPEPARHCAFITSTSVPKPVLNGYSNGYSIQQIEILNGLPAGHPGNYVCSTLHENLATKNFQTTLRKWSDDAIDDLCSYVILDSADRSLLTRVSPEQFKHITSLLTKASKMYWITLSDGTAGIVPNSGIVTGLARSARSEIDNILFFTLDVQDSLDNQREQILSAVLGFITTTETKIATQQALEFEYMLKDGQLHIQRFVRDTKLNKAMSNNEEEHEAEEYPFYQPERALKAHVEKLGLLSSLTFVDDEIRAPTEDEVEVRPFAWGVNFKDVFIALGQMKSTQAMAGECAGVVTRVGTNFSSLFEAGDRVAVMIGTPYSSLTRTSGNFVHKIPDFMSYADASSIPIAFATAYYSIVDCANLQKGDTILIHAASGGVGQAAIMIGQHIGATIFATVGSSAKRQLLMDKYSIPEAYIFSSRTTDFHAGVMRLTCGKGVDMVLNSLSEEALDASWKSVARLGTFVEIGKTDIYRRNNLSMEPFDRNVRFASVDLAVVAQARPKSIQDLLRRVFAHVESGHFQLLPTITFPIASIEQAFRLIQARKHTGKVVLEAASNSIVKARIPPLRLRSDDTYVIVGGLGSLGRQLCRHLQICGARHIAIFSRRAFDDDARRILEKELAGESDSQVKILTCDIIDASQVFKAAEELHVVFPPVRGVIQAAMVIADRTLSQMSVGDFRTALGPKYEGTRNVATVFTNDTPLDFFIMLSSVASVLGLRGQANYSAGNAYQDMFAHSMASKGLNFVSLNLTLMIDSDVMSQERVGLMARQGCEAIPMEPVLSLIDYAMAHASNDKCNQIAIGISPQSMLDRAENGLRIPPHLGNIFAKGQQLAQNSSHNVERTVEDSIAHASSQEETEAMILDAVKEKVSSLTAADSQDVNLDAPVTDLGLDSLVAIELKNWVTKTLQAVVQTTDIMDSPSLKAFAKLVLQKSALVKKDVKTVEKVEIAVEQVVDGKDGARETSPAVTEVDLPKFPLHSLDTTMQVFMESIGHLGNEQELQKTREAVSALLSAGGMGTRLQARLEILNNDPKVDNWLIDIYNRAVWLSARDMGPRGHNFFGTHELSKSPQTQAERAALISLAAFEYKLSLDAGTVKQDFRNEQPLCMETVHWLFNSNRVPVLGCDRVDRWPGNDYLAAMRHGHVYKVPLMLADGQKISHLRLKAIFQAIIQLAPEEVNWASVLTTGNRDIWAKTREEVITASSINEEFITTVEKSLFAVCLEDSSPANGNERATAFLFDENSNRWLDKTVSFIVCANGVSATWYQHAMIDGSTPNGLTRALSEATVDHIESLETYSWGLVSEDFKYIPFFATPSINARITQLRKQHLSSISGFSYQVHVHTTYGATYIRNHKLPPKTVFQLILQIAARRKFGYNPSSWDMVIQRQFKRGRFDSINVQTAEVAAFCAIAEDDTVSSAERRRLFMDAVKSHARFVALSTRGRGWMRHVMALKEVMEPGEELPALYTDPVYLRTRERKVFTSFGDSGALELGNFWADREALWFSCELGDNSARIFVANGEGRADEVVGYIKEASEVIRRIIEGLV